MGEMKGHPFFLSQNDWKVMNISEMNLRVWAVQDQGCLCAMVQEGPAIYTTPSPSILLIEEADI